MDGVNEGVIRHNFMYNAAEGALFIATGSLLSAQTVFPALIVRLGGGNLEVGAMSVIVWVGLLLPQIFAARHVETLPWKKPWAIRFGLSHRIMVALYGFALLALGHAYPRAALWCVLLFFTFCQLLAGVATPGWFDLFAKVTPRDRRGKLAGIRTSVGGSAAFVFGLVLTWLLDTFRFPYSFAIAFFLAFILQMASLIVQTHLIELEPSPVSQRQPFFAYLRNLPAVFRQKREFRNFIIVTPFSILATMPIGFYTVYALSRFHCDETVVGEFTLTIVAAQVFGSLATGYIADRYGYKISLASALVGLMLASLCALVAPSLFWFRLVYVFLGINLGTELNARYNISIEYGTPEQRSMYVGLMNTVLAPFYLSGMLGGWISDAWGYGAVFGVGLAFSVVGLLLFWFIVRDPRTLAAPAGPKMKATTG